MFWRKKMTFDQWVAKASRGRWPEDWRTGQAWFNQLSEDRPDLASQVQGNRTLDPYYNDGNLTRFMEFVQEHWNDIEAKR